MPRIQLAVLALALVALLSVSRCARAHHATCVAYPLLAADLQREGYRLAGSGDALGPLGLEEVQLWIEPQWRDWVLVSINLRGTACTSRHGLEWAELTTLTRRAPLPTWEQRGSE